MGDSLVQSLGDPAAFVFFRRQHVGGQQLASGQALAEQGEQATVAGDELIIVHGDVIREAVTLRSIAVRAEDETQALSLVNQLMKLLAFPMYVSTPDGVKAMVSTPLIAKPPRNLPKFQPVEIVQHEDVPITYRQPAHRLGHSGHRNRRRDLEAGRLRRTL